MEADLVAARLRRAGAVDVAARLRRAGAAAAVAAAGWLAAGGAVGAQEGPVVLAGRVVDAATGTAVEGAAVSLSSVRGGAADSVGARAVADGAGTFRFEGVGAGDYEIRVEHAAYGAFVERVALPPHGTVRVRIALSPAAIALDPVNVEAASGESRRGRAAGTARRRLTAAELEPAARSGDHLANALARLVPGMSVRSGRSQPGQLVCLEFRNPASLAAGGCRTPIVIVDNVRQSNGLITLNTLPAAHVHSVEALGPGEAGLRYGADSNHGAIVIETVTGGAPSALGGGSAGGGRGGVYDWARESQPYPWGRALGAALLANAVGLAAGYAASGRCLSFNDLSAHFADARCGRVGNAASRVALYAAPQIGVGHLAARIGATDLSRGNGWRNAAAGAIVAAPGIILALTGEEDGFGGSTAIGALLVLVGAPVATVLADRLYRDAAR